MNEKLTARREFQPVLSEEWGGKVNRPSSLGPKTARYEHHPILPERFGGVPNRPKVAP